MIKALGRKVTELGIEVADGQYVSSLLVDDGTCFGAYAFDVDTGARTVFIADAVVLAAGGHTRIWRRGSRRDENNGDGMYLALRAGCRLADMELVQFHPTGMLMPEQIAGTLVTEAVRGEGGRLFNSEGERFMERTIPTAWSSRTGPRPRRSSELHGDQRGSRRVRRVFLDISHIDKTTILEKLPRMYRQFIEHQMLDISSSPMEVAPTAHYSMGGVVVEPETHATDVEGLFAAGEVTTGLHGANRLGGNSLSETMVFGRRAGESAAKLSQDRDVQLRSRSVIEAAKSELDSFIAPGSEFARPLQRALRDSMWEHCGVVRNAEGLNKGLDQIDAIEDTLGEVDVRPSSEGFVDLTHVLDLRAALVTGRATLLGAIERRETRGSCHNRSDYNELDDSLNVNICIELTDVDELKLAHEQVPPVPVELSEWATPAKEIEVTGRLVE